MIRHRIRIRFCKQGDLRWISHRDLGRLFERLFRRVDLKLSMSEGFHPKPRMSFPLALGLGIAARDEVMELELAERVAPQMLQNQLNQHAPPGIVFHQVQWVEPGLGKAQAARLTYQIEVPAERRSATAQAVRQLLASPTCLILREGRDRPLDVRAGLEALQLDDACLRFTLAASRVASVRPREVLAALELSDLEEHGAVLERTAVELHNDLRPVQPDDDPSGEKGQCA